MCRSVPYLSLNDLLHPPQDHRCVSSLKRGCACRQTSVLTPLAEELGEGAGSEPANGQYESGVELRNVNQWVSHSGKGDSGHPHR